MAVAEDDDEIKENNEVDEEMKNGEQGIKEKCAFIHDGQEFTKHFVLCKKAEI